MKKVIITGSTGMVGKGILLECLESEKIKEVLVINRSSPGMKHPKLKEVLLKDFSKIESIKDKLGGYDACFYSMGVSSVGMKEDKYNELTFEITKKVANILYTLNPDMVFNYVSGSGTDSSEEGNTMWARVKGKTENMIFAKKFKDAYAFRPGAIIPEKGIVSKTGWYSIIYKILTPFFPLLKKLKGITTTTKIGLAMINTLDHPQELKILHNPDINEMA